MIASSLFDLSGRVAVIVGGTSGIGRALALGLAEAGADVVATGRREDLVREVSAEITAKGRRLFDQAVELLNAEVFGTVGLDEEELDLLARLIGKIRATEGDLVSAPEPRAAARP